MRRVFDTRLNAGRLRDHPVWGTSDSHEANGAFQIKYKDATLRIVASDGRHPLAQGWEHVSVSCEDRCPTWEEMCFVKDLFWHEEECVVQFHPPRSQYVNHHPRTLHLWKQIGLRMRTPPRVLIG